MSYRADKKWNWSLIKMLQNDIFKSIPCIEERQIKMKILFVTTKNVATTSGELRLIRNRAEVLKEHFNVDTKFISYIDQSRAENKNTDGVHNYFPTKYIEYNKKMPFTFFTKYNKFTKE